MTDALFLIGAGLVVSGAWMLSPAAGCLVAGSIILATSVAIQVKRQKTDNAR